MKHDMLEAIDKIKTENVVYRAFRLVVRSSFIFTSSHFDWLNKSRDLFYLITVAVCKKKRGSNYKSKGSID